MRTRHIPVLAFLSASLILAGLPRAVAADHQIPKDFTNADDANIWANPPKPEPGQSAKKAKTVTLSQPIKTPLKPSGSDKHLPTDLTDFSADLTHKLPDGRALLSQTTSLVLRRIPVVASPIPITHSTTNYSQWKVACESRGTDKACFAAAYTEFSGAILKIKFGPAIDTPHEEMENSPAGAKKSGSKKQAKSEKYEPHGQQYVVQIDGPPNLDIDTGFVLIAPHAIGIFPLTNDCNATTCRITARIDPALSAFLSSESNGGFAILATAQTSTYLWRFSTQGLKAAFDRVETETKARQISPPRRTSPNKALTPITPEPKRYRGPKPVPKATIHHKHHKTPKKPSKYRHRHHEYRSLHFIPGHG